MCESKMVTRMPLARLRVVLGITIMMIYGGCRKNSEESNDVKRLGIFDNISSNQLQNVVWNDAQGSLNITNRCVIHELKNVIASINGIPVDNTQKRLAIGDLRYDIFSTTTHVSFYTQGIISINYDSMYFINSKISDDILEIINSVKSEAIEKNMAIRALCL